MGIRRGYSIMNLEEIKRQVEDRLRAMNITNTKLEIKDGIEQLVIITYNTYLIVLDVLEINKTLIDKRPTIVQEYMYEKENNKYVIQKGFYLIDSLKGTQTVEQEHSIVDKILEDITGSNKPKFKTL